MYQRKPWAPFAFASAKYRICKQILHFHGYKLLTYHQIQAVGTSLHYNALSLTKNGKYYLLLAEAYRCQSTMTNRCKVARAFTSTNK